MIRASSLPSVSPEIKVVMVKYRGEIKARYSNDRRARPRHGESQIDSTKNAVSYQFSPGKKSQQCACPYTNLSAIFCFEIAMTRVGGTRRLKKCNLVILNTPTLYR